MDPARIAALLEPFLNSSAAPNRCHSESAPSGGEESAVLPSTTLQDISTYIDVLLRWNARINLTAIRDPDQIVTRHFGESLFAARHLFPVHSSLPNQAPSASSARSAAKTVADVGSGAGFPGIPFKLWAPYISLTLIESSHKKVAFLREIVRSLTLTDIDILNARAERLPAGLEHSFDVVTLRAVERFASILPGAASLLAPGGRLALLIGSSQLKLARETLPALLWSEPIPVPLSQSRVLLVANRRS